MKFKVIMKYFLPNDIPPDILLLRFVIIWTEILAETFKPFNKPENSFLVWNFELGIWEIRMASPSGVLKDARCGSANPCKPYTHKLGFKIPASAIKGGFPVCHLVV